MFSTQPPKKTAPLDELVIDFVVGWCSPLVLLFGIFVLFGHSALRGPLLFYGGGVSAIAFVHLALGNLRGQSDGNLWLKALCICGAILLIAANAGKLFFVIAALTFLPTAVGIWLRRRGFVLWRLRSILPANHLE